MKLKIILFTGYIFLLFHSVVGASTTILPNGNLSGKITDKISGKSLSGVIIYFPTLKTGTVSQSDGLYQIDQLPSAKLVVQISFMGYKMQSKQIDLMVISKLDFVLEESVTEISEVLVTGQSGGIEPNRTPSPIAIVPRMQLIQNSSSNIIDALSKVPGVSQVTTGSGISKPVIRGLGFNRVVVLNDGIRQEGQQWGDEHGIEIDANTIYRVEILKGPASLVYGSDAMAGVINLISAPTLPEGKILGNISSNYQSNNGLVDLSANLSGHKKGFIWDTRYSNKMAHSYQNKTDGWVYNSGFREKAAHTTLGINRSWGFSHLHLSWYNLKPGIVEGERDSLTGQFLKTYMAPDGTTKMEIANSSDFHSYQPSAPFQTINHYKVIWNNNLYFGKNYLEATLGWQQNQRKEFEDADQFGLFFVLNTLHYDFKYTLPDIKNWKFTTGINGMYQNSQNKGTEFLVPAYQLLDFGVFAIANKKMGNFDFSGGIRFDRRGETSESLFLNEEEAIVSASQPGAKNRFEAFDQSFTGFSGSLGLTYQISQSVYTKVNVSRGFRAPNIAELGSNGEHEGTQRYEIGNPDLKPESSLQFDFSIGMNTTHVSSELNLFTNSVDHFIFSNKLNDTEDLDQAYGGLPVFQFTEGNAHFYGGEFQLDIHPHPYDWLHLENSFSYVIGQLDNQSAESEYLPFIPAPVWVSDVKVEFDNLTHFLANSYLKVGIDKTWKQNHYYSAYNTETATPGYTLLNMGMGTDFVFGEKTRCSLYISASNLTNVAYQSHLSRLKYTGINLFSENYGIYNIGRNFSIKLLVPIDFSNKRTAK